MWTQNVLKLEECKAVQRHVKHVNIVAGFLIIVFGLLYVVTVKICFSETCQACQEYSSERILWYLKLGLSHKNTSCWASIQKNIRASVFLQKPKYGQTFPISPVRFLTRPTCSLRTCDHGPTLHWVGQECRLQDLRVSGRSSLQCLLWMERVVLSSDGWTQLTERICIPVFPHGLLQFCHSPVTQLENMTGEREKREFWGHSECQECRSKQWKRRKRGGFTKLYFYSWLHIILMHTWVEGRASGCSLSCLL